MIPDIIEIVQKLSDKLPELQAKMLEYRDNGVRLGLLINPQDSPEETLRERQVEIYRLGVDVEVLQSPVSVSWEDVLPGFILNLDRII